MCESLIGLYWSYYELVSISEKYKDRVSLFIIADGYDKLTDNFLKCASEANIYDERKLVDKAFVIKAGANLVWNQNVPKS